MYECICTNLNAHTHTHIHTCMHTYTHDAKVRMRAHTHTTLWYTYTLRKLFGLLFFVTGLIRLEGSISSSSSPLVACCHTSSPSLLLSRMAFLALFGSRLPESFLFDLSDALLDTLSSSLAFKRLDLLGVLIFSI